MENEEKSEQQKIQEARDCAECIIDAISQPLLVLDADLKIISANRSFYDTFKAAPLETIGVSIYDLGNQQWNIPKLRDLLENILPKKTSFDDFEVVHDFPGLGTRIMLVNARQVPKFCMILLVIEDITESRKILDGLHEEILRLEALHRSSAGREHVALELKRKIDELEKRILRRRL